MEVITQKKNTILIVWIIPLIALAMASWMVYEKYRNDGKKIVVVFNSADGFTINKTPLKYKGVEVGRVTDIQFDKKDLNNVNVTITLSPEASEAVARAGNVFWKVAPRISLEGISGLSTIINGVYIAVMPKASNVDTIMDEKEQTKFQALNIVPIEKEGGIVISLNTNSDNLGIGAPILYKNFQIGAIKNKSLKDDGIEYKVLIDKEYTNIIKDTSEFYMLDSIELTANLSGIKLNIGSLNSILTGGVEVVNGVDNNSVESKLTKEVFKLYDSKRDLELSKNSIFLHAKEGYNLIENYSKVYYKGIEAGIVSDIGFNVKNTKTNVSIKLKEEFSFLMEKHPYFWIVRPQLSIEGVEGLNALAQGSYISFDINSNKQEFADGTYALHETPFVEGTKEVILHTTKTHSLKSGSAIYYKNLQVGSIYYVGLEKKKNGVLIKGIIQDRYAKYVNDSSRFFLNSGLEVDASLSGVKIKSGPLRAIFAGGIAFVTPKEKTSSKKKDYILFESQKQAQEKYFNITLKLNSSNGLSKDSKVVYKGITIGFVEDIDLDRENVIAKIKIYEDYKKLINAQTLFWVKNFSLGLDGVKNASSILGAQIAIYPGVDSKFATSFEALDSGPPISFGKNGLRVIVKSDRKSSLGVNSPLYYRQMQIGIVEDYYLSEDSTSVNMVLFIDPCYSYLIRKNSIFYNATAIGFDVSLTGIKVSTETVESMISGALVVVTPMDAQEEVSNMSSFQLVNEADASWLAWKPKLINKNMMCESIF